MEDSAVVVGYGEVGTKSSSVRTKMERRLREQVAAALDAAGVAADVERRWSRIVIRTDDAATAAGVCGRLPGVISARPSTVCQPTMSAITATLSALAAMHPPDATVAVRATRAGPADAHPFSSRDIEREGGRAVVEATGATVDLDDPDVTYRVECREEEAFVSTTTVEGPGGLPLGTQGRAVTLLSGGIDSPVAAWETMRRGCLVAPVYVDLGDYGGPDHRGRAEQVASALAERAPCEAMALRVVPMGPLVADLVEAVVDTRMLSLRRAMLVAAEELAEELDAHSLVTGESMGQKSSQTGVNLRVTDAAATLPVHRPLLTWDKSDIVAAARELGTYDDATLPVGCERVAPDHPETYATLEGVLDAEPDDLLPRARAAAREATIVRTDR
jgi:thiamine biosynthesis protein ThiI